MPSLAEMILERAQEMQRKRAAMEAGEVQQEAGGGAAPPGAAPAGAAPAGAAPAGAVDPATGMPVDPATGMPVDPATGMPMDPAAMGMPPAEPAGPPPTFDELLASGDPIVAVLGEIRDTQAAILSALKALLDSGQIQVPASKLLDQDSAAVAGGRPAPPAEPKSESKSAMSPGLVDDTDPDADEFFSPLPAAEPMARPVSTLKLGSQPGDAAQLSDLQLGRGKRPGEGGAAMVETGFVTTSSRNRSLVGMLRNHRSNS